MTRLRVLAAMALAGSMILAGGGVAAGASPQQSAGRPAAVSLPLLPGLPYFDFGFDCSSPFLGGNTSAPAAAPAESLFTTTSFVVINNQQFGAPRLPSAAPLTGIPGIPTIPGLQFGGGSLDLMKCLFTYPAGTVPNAPFIISDFTCDYDSDATGDHFFGQNMLIVRDTWALMSCLGSEVDARPNSSSRSGHGG